MTSYRECFLRIVQNHDEKNYFRRFKGAIAPLDSPLLKYNRGLVRDCMDQCFSTFPMERNLPQIFTLLK